MYCVFTALLHQVKGKKTRHPIGLQKFLLLLLLFHLEKHIFHKGGSPLCQEGCTRHASPGGDPLFLLIRASARAAAWQAGLALVEADWAADFAEKR